MNPNDETIYQPTTEQDGSENNEVMQENAAPKSEKKSNGWAKVTISGVTGILMGAGGMYAGKPYVDEMTDEWRESLADMLEEHDIPVPEWLRPQHPDPQIAEGGSTTPQEESPETGIPTDLEPSIVTNPEPAPVNVHPEPQPIPAYIPSELHIASVDQNLSFGHAFAQARAEVGPGGVFYWHGGVYNTYTEAEWNSMSAADRSDFAQHVAPAVYHPIDHPVDDVVMATPADDTPDANGAEAAVGSDVHILGVNQYVNEDGSIVNAGFANIDGEPVVMIDVDGDGTFDAAYHDANHNGAMDEDEVFDITSEGITTDAWAAEAIADGNSEDGTFNPGQPDENPQDDLAAGMPDYVNDGDVSDIYSA